MSASLRDRAATPSEPSPAVSGIAGIPSAEPRNYLAEDCDELDRRAEQDGNCSGCGAPNPQCYCFDDDRDCWNCGGEGYVADCFDGFCVNAEDGCELCMRHCEYCNPPKRAASAIEARRADTPKSESVEDESAPGRPEPTTHQDRDNVK